MGTTELWLLGQDTVDAVKLAYATHAVDLPSRQYVTVGEPVDDCPQLVVWLGRLYTGLPADEVSNPERCGFARTLEINIRITRCVPVVDDEGRAPNPDTIEGTSLLIAEDLWVLPQGVIEQYDLGNFLSQCQDLIIGNCIPFPWSGGVGGVELQLRAQVDQGLG